MGDAEQGQLDFQACLKFDENNKAAKHQLQLCAAKIKADKLKEKKLYGGMFEKFARMDKAVSSIYFYLLIDFFINDIAVIL